MLQIAYILWTGVTGN